MAHDEMSNIRQLDSELLVRHNSLLWVYFAQCDEWIGQQKAAILAALGGDEARVFHGESGVQHAFCISELLTSSPSLTTCLRCRTDHSEIVGRQCYAWMDMYIT